MKTAYLANILLLFIFLLFPENSSASALSASVDRTHVNEDEMLILTIRCDAGLFTGQPDLAGLDSHFTIVSTSSGSQTSIINGAITSTKEWRYTLLPKRSGKLLIPSFNLKDNYTDAIEIDVMPAGSVDPSSQGSHQTESDLFIEQTLDKKEAYVQERITLTWRIYTAVSIKRPEIPDPMFTDFSVEKIGESEYQSRQNNLEYHILECQYALYATKSGVITLPKQRFAINQLINRSTAAPFGFPGFNMQSTQLRYISTAEQTLTIKPRPENVPASEWLPSDDVSISDNWPEQQTMDAGTPLTRRIEIKTLGNPAAHIPPLPALTITGLKMYGEQPLLSNNKVGSNILGTRKENMAIVGVEPGSYTLPEINIHWWSTRDKKLKVATLPARILIVTGTSAVAPSSNNALANPSLDRPSATGSSLMVDNTSIAAPFYLNVYFWIANCVILFVAWLVTLFVLLRYKKTGTDQTVSMEDDIRQQKRKEALKQLKAACLANDAQKSRELLMAWAHQLWPDREIRSLLEVKQRINNKTFNSLVDELDAAIYRSNHKESGSWNGGKLLDYLQAEKFNTSPDSKEATLPGLYH